MPQIMVKLTGIVVLTSFIVTAGFRFGDQGHVWNDIFRVEKP